MTTLPIEAWTPPPAVEEGMPVEIIVGPWRLRGRVSRVGRLCIEAGPPCFDGALSTFEGGNFDMAFVTMDDGTTLEFAVGRRGWDVSGEPHQ